MKDQNKQTIGEWWNENKAKIKVGVKCLAIGLGVGFIKGFTTTSKLNSEAMSKLIDKIPYEPDEDDLSEWVQTHPDEVLAMQKELSESELN